MKKLLLRLFAILAILFSSCDELFPEEDLELENTALKIDLSGTWNLEISNSTCDDNGILLAKFDITGGESDYRITIFHPSGIDLFDRGGVPFNFNIWDNNLISGETWSYSLCNNSSTQSFLIDANYDKSKNIFEGTLTQERAALADPLNRPGCNIRGFKCSSKIKIYK